MGVHGFCLLQTKTDKMQMSNFVCHRHWRMPGWQRVHPRSLSEHRGVICLQLWVRLYIVVCRRPMWRYESVWYVFMCLCHGLWLIVFVMLRYSDVFTDVDECLELPQTCDGVGQCVNILGSYQCNCPQGYRQVNGTSCHGETIHQTNSHIQHRGCVWNRILLYNSYCFCKR